MDGDNEEEVFYDADESIFNNDNNKSIEYIPSTNNELKNNEISVQYSEKLKQEENKIDLNIDLSKGYARETVYEDAQDLANKKIIGTLILQKTPENVSENLTEVQNLEDQKIREKEKARKTEILKEELKEIKIDIEFLNKNYKMYPSKSKGIKDKHLHTLFELQCFQGDNMEIWVTKISVDGKFLATGGKSGVLKIWKIFSEEESLDNYEFKGLLSYLKFVNENAYRVYTEHTKDIVDLSWNPNHYNLLLTASLDHNVILWDVNKEIYINKFVHSAMVSAISFFTNSDENQFVSGCFDKIVRIWDISKSKVVDYINVQEYITAVSYFPSGDQIIVGSHTGKCSIYDRIPKLRYNYYFVCKNKSGKYSDGRKVTNIEFIDEKNVLITTNDSRVRLINASDGKTIQKYKGHLNDEHIIRANFEDIYDLIISASDDGYVYVWKKINPLDTFVMKNKSYEFFKSFSDKENVNCSFFANDMSLSTYIKKLLKITQKFYIKSIIVNTSNTGKIQILINTEI